MTSSKLASIAHRALVPSATFISVLALAATLFVPASAFAAFATTPTIYVDASAPAGGDGSSAHPYQTIQSAVDAASTGAVIGVEPGTYTEAVQVNKSVTIEGDTGTTLVVNATTVNGFNVTANNVTIEGFDIEGPAAGTSYLTYNWASVITRGIFMNNGVTNFAITDNTIEGLRNDILIDGRTTGSVTGNTIDDSKSGISVQYTDGTAYDQSTPNSTPVIVITGNTQGTFGDEWGVNYHLDGHWNGVAGDESHPVQNGAPYGAGSPIAAVAPASVQAALLANSAANGGWSVQDQAYTSENRTSATIATTGSSANQGSPLSSLDTFQDGVNAVVAGGTVNVDAGTYSGDVTIATPNLTIQGTGSVNLNLGSGYGFDLDEPGNIATGFTMNGITVNASPSTTYAFKAYHADGLTLTNDTLNGGAGNTGGGVDINTTNNVKFNNVTSTGFAKNGFADTSAYTSADSTASGNNITFNGITSSNNGWNGIAFYTTGNSGGAASITGVQFTGANTISGNGTTGGTQGGIFIEGDSDSNLGLGSVPKYSVTTSGGSLDLTHVAFSGNAPSDIFNYQTAPVNAIGATFGGTTGDNMTGTERTAEDAKIVDQLDNPALGLVSYYTYVNDSTQSLFEESPSYVRSNNSGDIAAVALVPAQATAAQFTFTQTDGSNVYTDVAGTEHIQSGQFPIPSTGQHQYRVGVSAAAGTYTITGQYEVNGTWYPITGTATTYVLDNPTATFVFPTPTANTYRPSDDPVRVSVDDANDSFSDVVFGINGMNYTVDRSQCDLREAGNRVLCDVTSAPNWSDLADGTYTATAIVYNQARGNTEITSDSFTVDDSVPVVTNFQIDPTAPTYGSSISVSADATDSSSPIENVDFFVTAPRAADGVCDGNGTILADSTVTSATSGDTYSTTLDTSALTGPYCVDVAVENTAATHSLPQEISVNIDNTVAAPTPSVMTDAATNASSTDATLNGTNGPVGASGSSFWVSTSPFTVASGTNPTLPSGVYSTLDLGSQTAGTDYGVSLSSLTNAAYPNAMPSVTASTTYYYAAWVNVGGTWYPGAVQTFTTSAGTSAGPNAPGVSTRVQSNVSSSDATLNGKNGDNDATDHSFWVSTILIKNKDLADGVAPTLPAGAYSTLGLGPIAANAKFSVQLSSLATAAYPSAMPAVTASTTYYYIAWSQVDGVWYHGNVKSFTTSGAVTPPATSTPSVPTLETPGNATTLNTNSFNFTWDASTGGTGTTTYQFQSTQDPTEAGGVLTNSLWASTTPTNSIVSSGAPDGTWYWQVRAEDASGDLSDWSPIWSVILNTSGTSTPVVASSTPSATTDAATNVTSTDATLNGTNGPVAADDESFWVSTSTIDTSDPSNIPAGVYSTPVLTSGAAASTTFMDQLSLVTTDGITTGGVPGNMPSIQPNTTYYYVAWTNVGDVWYHGAVESLTTSIAPTGPAPVAESNSITVPENSSTPITLAVSSGGTVTYNIVDQPANGTLSAVSGDSVTYTPKNNYTGGDSFTFEANNGQDSNVATIMITVTHVTAPAPTASAVTATSTDDAAVAITLMATSTSDAALTYATTSPPMNGTLSAINGDTVTYTPNSGFTGTDTFTYNAGDGTATSSDATVTINVTAAQQHADNLFSGFFAGGSSGQIVHNGGNGGHGNNGNGGSGSGQVLGASAYNFTKDLKVGSTGEDVTQLQLILIADGDLKITSPTGYFGALTKAAVMEYQAAHNISPVSGYVGPITRAVLNAGSV